MKPLHQPIFKLREAEELHLLLCIPLLDGQRRHHWFVIKLDMDNMAFVQYLSRRHIEDVSFLSGAHTMRFPLNYCLHSTRFVCMPMICRSPLCWSLMQCLLPPCLYVYATEV
jgi:hypothetical protein